MNEINEKLLLELLEVVEEQKAKESTPVDPKKKRFRSIYSFLEDNNITSGLDRIPTYVVYYTYYQTTDTPVDKKWFFRIFKSFHTQARVGKQRYYLLNKSQFDMSREGLLKAKHLQQTLKKGKK
jgi:hypothetical protein